MWINNNIALFVCFLFNSKLVQSLQVGLFYYKNILFFPPGLHLVSSNYLKQKLLFFLVLSAIPLLLEKQREPMMGTIIEQRNQPRKELKWNLIKVGRIIASSLSLQTMQT